MEREVSDDTLDDKDIPWIVRNFAHFGKGKRMRFVSLFLFILYVLWFFLVWAVLFLPTPPL